jgi:hypothetical protein
MLSCFRFVRAIEGFASILPCFFRPEAAAILSLALLICRMVVIV